MSNALTTLSTKLASSLGMGNGEGLLPILKATAFKGNVSDSQMAALLVVANQYKLNPWTREIYAFPDRNNGIVPVVGVDGWSRIINEHPQFDGMDFAQDEESCTCTIYRKDRTHPIKVTEWMEECKRDGVGPWKSHPRRMLRHKAMIQCARIAFGFAGIFDQDEAERIVEPVPVIDQETGEIVRFNLEVALRNVADADSVESLSEVWKSEGKKAVDAKDKAGHAALKAAVIERKAVLENVTDVEANEVAA